MLPAYHSFPAERVLAELSATPQGLSTTEAEQRLQKYGPNTIVEEEKIHPFRIFLEQFASPIVWILLAAMLISGLLREWADFSVIAVIVVLNAILGFVQEYRAEEAIAHLKKLVSPKATVLRDGKETELPADQLVPGDVVLLVTGDRVPADCRLISVTNLQTQEAALTGESTPVHKQTAPVGEHAALGDRKSMVYSGTIVTRGKARAVVTGTGMQTEIGNIAALIQTTEKELTPLQKKLASFSRFLGIVVVVIAVIIFAAGLLRGMDWFEMLLAAIALAVAAIPEGLPAVVTVVLAVGVQRMAQRNALVRKLPSVETLGACTVICADKTGTLTHNEMTVKKLFVNGQVAGVGGSGYAPEGGFTQKPEQFSLLLTVGALNNDAKLRQEGNDWKVIGDPTEAALLVSAKKAGLDLDALAKKYPRLAEIEFTSERKLMTTIHKGAKGRVAFTKGAPEVVLGLCEKQLVNGRVVRLTRADREKILEANTAFARQALRVLGFAYKSLTGKEKAQDIERELVFVGLQAMIDPPRPEVRDAIKKCRTAGIRVVMITGDHLETAQAIAKELGISGSALTGEGLDHIADLHEQVEEIGVYARVNPAHKIRIVEAFQHNGHVVAMTGDGVNDAPALKKANLGVAMGITGTDVAKEASAMVLADDNFATIVRAVEEGRVIFDNIKKFVEYLLSSNMGEVLTLFVGILLGWPLPMTALMILWINLITDGAPALALGVDPPEPGVMERPARAVEENIVNAPCGIMIVLIGIIMMLGTLFVFDWYQPMENLAKAQTVAFTTLVLFQMFNVLNQRSETKSLLQVGVFRNKWLWGAVLLSVGLQAVVVYVPFLQELFGTVALGAMDWAMAVGVSASVLVFGELAKLVMRL